MGSSDPSQVGIIRRALNALRHLTVEEHELTQSQRDAIAQHKVALAQRDVAVAQHKVSLAQRDVAIKQRDVAITSKIWKLFKPYRRIKKATFHKSSKTEDSKKISSMSSC